MSYEQRTGRAKRKPPADRRKLTLADVEITIETEEEDIGIEGHFDDKETEREIIESYNGGNGYAWCCAKVTAQWTDTAGVEHTGADYLGAISCLPTEDMTASQAFDALVKDHEMQQRALDALQHKVNEYDRRQLERMMLEAIAGAPEGELKQYVIHEPCNDWLYTAAALEMKRRAIK